MAHATIMAGEGEVYTSIKYELYGDVAFIRLNEPDTLNAMSASMSPQLMSAMTQAEQMSRCIVIGSVGRAFCSGANLTDGDIDMDDTNRDVGAGVEAVINPLIMKIRNSRVPVITAVRGAAAGVGCGIACAGDIIVAGEGAYFYQAFSRVGLSPDGGSSYLLSKAIGRVRAMELMLLGDRLPARQALEWGLITRVVPDEDVDSVALELAQKLAAGPRSLGMIREAAWQGLDQSLEIQLMLERNFQREAGRTEDFAEGVSAFREKRPAAFKGN
jgi:2-(1,2-epoxy-1,2-dihydrophenyl)acetyl-CoA isomerase